jgi:hypothetical protein
MSIDNCACLILGLPGRELNFVNIKGCSYEDGHGTHNMHDMVERVSEDQGVNLDCQQSNNSEWYIGFTLARTRSYGMCEVPPFDLTKLTLTFAELFGVVPKLYLLEQQS